MRRPAKILLAGTLAAILPCAPATSQTLFADQVETGDFLSSQTLDVVEANSLAAGAVSLGNHASFGVADGDMDVRANQTLQGNVRTDTHATVRAAAGPSPSLVSSATGNMSEGGLVGGTHTGVYTQRTGSVSVSALSHLEAPDAEAGDIASSVQAAGNSQGVWAGAAATGVRVNQDNQATVASDGGGNIGYSYGRSIFAATSAANNVNVSGAGSAQRLIVDQRNNADVTQASQFTAYGYGYVTATQATAAGNNITAGEQGPLLDMATRQRNLAYVRAQSENSAYEFGSGAAAAHGVGNSMAAGNAGATVIDNVQINEGGGVESLATFTGGQGYDASASASAIGNATAGFVCSDCEGRFVVSNSQTNGAEIGATANAGATRARSLNGMASATGNTATYYVTRPSR